MSITQKWVINLSCVTCICSWHENFIFKQCWYVTDQLHLYFTNYYSFICQATLIPLAMCLHLPNAHISSNTSVTSIVILGKISLGFMDLILQFTLLCDVSHKVVLFTVRLDCLPQGAALLYIDCIIGFIETSIYIDEYMLACIHTYMHTYINNTYIHTYIHTLIRTGVWMSCGCPYSVCVVIL